MRELRIPCRVPRGIKMKLETVDDTVIGAIIADAREIANRRVRILERLRDALLKGDNETALRYAHELCGLEEDGSESNSVDPSKHPGTGSR